MCEWFISLYPLEKTYIFRDKKSLSLEEILNEKKVRGVISKKWLISRLSGLISDAGLDLSSPNTYSFNVIEGKLNNTNYFLAEAKDRGVEYGFLTSSLVGNNKVRISVFSNNENGQKWIIKEGKREKCFSS